MEMLNTVNKAPAQAAVTLKQFLNRPESKQSSSCQEEQFERANMTFRLFQFMFMFVTFIRARKNKKCSYFNLKDRFTDS